MNDQERMTDFLCSEKKMTSNYDTYASECVNIPLRDAFLGLFNQGHHTQTELFQLAQSKGWYQPEQAQADKISQAYTKFSNQKPQVRRPGAGPFPGREKELGKKAGIH